MLDVVCGVDSRDAGSDDQDIEIRGLHLVGLLIDIDLQLIELLLLRIRPREHGSMIEPGP